MSADWKQGHDHRISFFTPPVRPAWYYVYLAWGEDRSRPLYVGKSNHLLNRVDIHLNTRDWVREVREWECFAFPTNERATIAETEAIHELNPIHNVLRLPLSVVLGQLSDKRERGYREQA